MKKYPYSTKALKAMLIATLAFTPLASFSTVKAEAASVEYSAAAYDSVEVLIERLDAVYDGLSDGKKQELETAQYNLDVKISDTDWENYASRISKPGSGYTVQKGELLKAFVDLSLSENVRDLEAKISTFKSEQSDNVNLVFGSDINGDKLLNFIAGVEINLLNKNLDLETISEARMFLEIAAAMSSVAGNDNTSDNYKVYNALLDEVNIEAIPTVITEIKSKLSGSGGTGGGGGGGGSSTGGGSTPGTDPVTDGGTVEVTPDTIADNPTAIVDAIKEATDFTELEISEVGTEIKVELPQTVIEALKEKTADATVVVSNELGSYTLPVSEINMAELAQQLGVNAADVKIVFNLSLTEDTVNVIGENGLNAVAPIVEFSVVAQSEDGKSVSIKAKFSTFIERTIVGENAFNANRSIAVRLNDNGTFSAIPTLFEGNTATIKSLTNSKYTIVENDKTFTDVDGGKSWAEAHIEKLASKYIIFGKTETTYAPSKDITRGEFAALISRSLGLVAEDASKAKFTDVPAKKGINTNGEINAAAEAGIIAGIGGGKFAPNAKIKRVDAAIMIARAMTFTKVPDSKLDKENKVTDFKDYATINKASQSGVEKVLQAGIMGGIGNDQFDPNSYTKRDQMAKVIDQFLKISEMGN